MLPMLKIPVFFKIYVLMICCVITVGIASATITSQTKAVSKRYFSSNDNPAKNFLPLLDNLRPIETDQGSKAERDVAFAVVSKKLQRINVIGFCINAVLQLLLVLIYTFFLKKLMIRNNSI